MNRLKALFTAILITSLFTACNITTASKPTENLTNTQTKAATTGTKTAEETATTTEPTATAEPTVSITDGITAAPTASPTAEPTPTARPTQKPTATPKPTTTSNPTAPVVPSGSGNLLQVNSGSKSITITGHTKKGGTTNPTINFSKSVKISFPASMNASFNQYTFTVWSSQPLRGKISYADGASYHEEPFYIEKTTQPYLFRSYIDLHMQDKKGGAIRYITLDNTSSLSATVEIKDMKTTTAAPLPTEVYISNSYLKIGTDLKNRGGGLNYYECLYGNVAAVKKNGRVEVGPGYASQANDGVLTTSVNLLNTYDTGRLVQQSYYGISGAPYVPGSFTGRDWPYNPVMGGDCGFYPSKIVDYKKTSTSIYVKCIPMDWGKHNEPTISYMEAIYTLEGKSLRVDNRFIDFSGYSNPATSQETPAFYVIEPLNTLVRYNGSKPWTNDTLTTNEHLPFWDGKWPDMSSKENWWAWVNDNTSNPFGIGLYVPGVDYATGGIFMEDGYISNDPSKSNPTSYIAPLSWFALRKYKPITYSYYIAAGTVNEMRSFFESKKGTINNTF